jgi:4-hydroxy-tetrahydrodipicolinate synthase
VRDAAGDDHEDDVTGFSPLPPNPDAGQVQGIMGACLTPFDEGGRIDYAALERELEFMIPDCDAITVGAVEAAEYTMLTVAERKELMRRATEIIDGRVPVILGASAPAIRMVLEFAETAAEVGGDLIQILMPIRPWGGQPTMSELYEYFAQIAAESPLPIVAYHNPACGGDPPVDAWVELAQLFGVHYFKESSRNIIKIGRLIEEVDLAGHARYFTTMQPLLVTLMMGGSGGTMPPPGTRIGAQVVAAFREGDLERARIWQRLYGIFPAKWSAYGLAPVMKASLRHFGVDIGDPAVPYRPVSVEDDARIGQFFRETGLVDGDTPNAESLRKVVASLSGEDTFLR